VVVSELKQGPIPCAGDGGQETAHLVLGEKRELGGGGCVWSRVHESDSICVLSDSCSPPWRKYSLSQLM
jgi:hypothetical protein